MYDFNHLWALCSEIDENQSKVSNAKTYALTDAFSEYLATVKPTGYEIIYNPVDLYQVVYCENGERQISKGWIYGFTSYNKAAMALCAMMEAYKAGQQDKGGVDSVF